MPCKSTKSVNLSYIVRVAANRALPFQLYHSIQARGENVEDVLRAAEDGNTAVAEGNDEDATVEQPLTSFKEGDGPYEEAEDAHMADAQTSPQFKVRILPIFHEFRCFLVYSY